MLDGFKAPGGVRNFEESIHMMLAPILNSFEQVGGSTTIPHVEIWLGWIYLCHDIAAGRQDIWDLGESTHLTHGSLAIN